MKRACESSSVASREVPSMRLDLFLKLSRIIPRRSLAQEICDHGSIAVNGSTAKSSRLIRAGDLIQWRQRHKVTTIKVEQIPRVRPGKADADALYLAVRTEDAQRPQE